RRHSPRTATPGWHWRPRDRRRQTAPARSGRPATFSVVARGLDAEPILRPLARIAKAMIHSPETDPRDLRRGCDAVQDAAQVQFEPLLNDPAKGRTENVRVALAKDPALASRRGMHNRTLAWVATYRNRPKILELTLNAGGDCNTPACDPMRATMA